jgi:hypothetical protein
MPDGIAGTAMARAASSRAPPPLMGGGWPPPMPTRYDTRTCGLFFCFGFSSFCPQHTRACARVDARMRQGCRLLTRCPPTCRYHGEQFDGRVVDTPAQWSPATPAKFDTGLGKGAVPADQALGQTVLLTMPPLQVSRKYTPVTVHKVGGSTMALHGGAAIPPSFVRCTSTNHPLCGDNIWFEDTKAKTRYDYGCRAHAHAMRWPAW